MLASLGCLCEAETQAVESLLARCVEGRMELVRQAVLYRDIVALLAYLPAQRRPPERLKQRVFDEIERRGLGRLA